MSDKKGPDFDDNDTRPHRRPAILENMKVTRKVTAVKADSTEEIDLNDEAVIGSHRICEDEATELMNRDEILSRLKLDRQGPAEAHARSTVQVPVVSQVTVPELPTLGRFGGVDVGDHLRNTVDIDSDKEKWIEFVAKVDKEGNLVLPAELVKKKIFKPGQNFLIRVRGLED